MSSFSSIVRGIGCKRKSILSTLFRPFIKKSDALAFGSAFHKSLEEGLSAGLVELDKAGLFSDADVFKEMYLRQQQLFLQNGIEMLDHEMEFSINIEGLQEPFVGFIDGLAMYNGEPWLVEFKTARYIDVSHVDIDSQITAYLWACRFMGLEDVKGMIYVVNQKSMNKKPAILKSGDLSTAKNQGCLYNDYMEKAREIYGEDIPQKILNHADWIKKNEKPLVVAVKTTRTKEQIDKFEEMLYGYVKQEQDIKNAIKSVGFDEVLRNTPCFPTKMCFSACDFSKECKRLLIDSNLSVNNIDEDMYRRYFEGEETDDKINSTDIQD